MSNYNRTSSSERNNSERYNQSERGKNKNKLSPAAKKAAAVLLTATVLFSAGAANHDKIGKWFGDSFTYSSVDKNVEGPKVEASIGKPNVLIMFDLDKLDVMSHDKNGRPNQYMTDNGATIDAYKVDKNEVPVLLKGADVRTSPVVGSPEDNTHTTIVTVEEEVPLNNVSDYYYYQMGAGYGDTYIGFPVDEIQKSFPNAKMKVDNDNIDWVNAKEVKFVDNDKK